MKNNKHVHTGCRGCKYLKLHASKVYGGLVELCMRQEGFKFRGEGGNACYDSGKAKAYIKIR